MSKIRSPLLIASLIALGLNAAPAYALNTQSFVSATGLDTNNCTRPTPCRTLQEAHNKTNAGGEIQMLDPADYGPVNINKAISIINDGVGSAGILVKDGTTDGVTINAGATDTVNLRGLIIEGASVGRTGIKFSTGKSLTIANCVVRNLADSAIYLTPSSSSDFVVSNTIAADSKFGVVIGAFGSGTVRAVLNRVELHNNVGDGFEVSGVNSTGSVIATVTDSVSANNGGHGFLATSGPNKAATSLMLLRSVAADNSVGFEAGNDANTVLRLAQSTVTGNSRGWSVVGGAIVNSYGDNNIDGNVSQNFAPPAIAKK
jgi:hypothetical protein